MIVYKLKNNINDKFYIGQTKSMTHRLNWHISQLKYETHHNIHLQRFYNKHKDTIVFSYEVLFESDDKEMIDEFEIAEIEKTFLYNYNLSKKASGGDLLSYHPNRDFIIRKISKSLIDNSSKMTKEEKIIKWARYGSDNPNFKHGNTLIDIFCSECNKKLKTIYVENKIYLCTSCNAKGRTKEKNPFYGKTHTDEFKKKLSEKMKGKPNTRDSKKVSIDGIIYNSYTEASKILGCTTSTISNRVKNIKFINYYDVI